MKQIKKHFLFVYIVVAIIALGFIITIIIFPASNKLYQYVPADCEIVIEINTNNFIKEVGYQWIYQPSLFDSTQASLKDDKIPDNVKNIGINPFGKILIFNEIWADESLWFAVINVSNKDDFNLYLKNNFKKAKVQYDNSIAIVQISASNNQGEVTNHIKNLLAKKIKSIESNPVVKSEFSNSHEINIYLKSLKSDYVTDGYLNINFKKDKIDISGYFHPIGSNNIEPIAYATEPNIGISLRSSLNLLNSIYLFNDTKLEYLPDYKQIAFDYDGVNLITNNDVIPVTSYPNINMDLDIYDEKVWLQYIDANVEDGSLLISHDTIMINSEVKAKIRYKIANQKFSLYQNEKVFAPSSDGNNTYFDLKIHPQQIIEEMKFKEDEVNPPKLVASQIIKIVKSILEDFTYIKAIDEMYFTIEKDTITNDYLSTGHIIYHNKNGNSIIESYLLIQNFLQTAGHLLY